MHERTEREFMAAHSGRYEELIRQFGALGAVKRAMARTLPADCPSGSAAVLTLLGRHGDLRMSKLAELQAVDISVTSRYAAHLAERGWIRRSPDPADRRGRVLRLTPAGRDRLRELTARTCDLLSERLAAWSDDDIARLTELMARLRADFDDGRDGREERDGHGGGRAAVHPTVSAHAHARVRTQAHARVRT